MTHPISRKQPDSALNLLCTCLLLCMCAVAARSLSLGAAPPGSADGRSDLNGPVALVFSAASVERRMGEENIFKRLLNLEQASPPKFYTVPFEGSHGRLQASPLAPGFMASRASRLITRGPPSTT